ncbi:disease resistance protein SUMM2-like [Cornus florida]|uniref:disease resistance protein SUMM2-like n=1 Tax=Cornus florida TaxID=4283 RepID=UPI002897B9A8|nr:disease resistance protein SUMM2-like [Cornus florida]XP_059661510.1 disease resistance protein SUMM2-like [Cornus florida]
MGMEFLVFLALGIAVPTQFLEKLWNKVELLKNVWKFATEFPELINYHNHLKERVQTLKGKMETLGSQEQDLSTQLEQAEFQSGNKRKREVHNWLETVQSKRNKVESTCQDVQQAKIYRYAWLESCVEKHIQEVEELIQQGRFPADDLLLKASQTKGVALVTTKLVGHVTPEENMEEILRHLTNDEISRIGVLGNAGVGKTAIMSHINNSLLENTSTFDHVYWLTVSQEFDIRTMQNDIAGVVGVDLPEERDEMQRAARLHEALQKRSKNLLILDGLSKHFPLDKVGIQTTRGGCKLILTTQSSKVCGRMGCKIIMLKSLLSEEAEELFMEKLGLNSPLPSDFEQIAKQIVKECNGLPGKIINVAEKLMGVVDINEWNNALNEETESKNRLTD